MVGSAPRSDYGLGMRRGQFSALRKRARLGRWLAARSPIAPGRPLVGVRAASEPLTRHLGLPVGMLRTARSLTAVRPRRQES